MCGVCIVYLHDQINVLSSIFVQSMSTTNRYHIECLRKINSEIGVICLSYP